MGGRGRMFQAIHLALTFPGTERNWNARNLSVGTKMEKKEEVRIRGNGGREG